MTLFEIVTKELDRQSRKHDLGEDYTEKSINRMSNYELIQHISFFLEVEGYEIARQGEK